MASADSRRCFQQAFRRYLAASMKPSQGECALAVAGLAAEYAMGAEDEQEHGAFLTDWTKLRKPVLYAARRNDLLLLQWTRARCATRWDPTASFELAMGKSLGLLRWATHAGCPLGSSVYIGAAIEGDLSIARWARLMGVPWSTPADAAVCSISHVAAKGRHLAWFRWAIATRAPGWQDVCTLAAAEGDLEMLQWAHEQGAPLDTQTCRRAGRNGHLEVFRWIHETGCPLVEDMSEGVCCYNNFVNLTMFGMQRLVQERVYEESGEKAARLCHDRFVAGYGEGWPERIRLAASYGASFVPGDEIIINTRFAARVPKTPAEWDAYQAWLEAKCAGRQAAPYDGVR